MLNKSDLEQRFDFAEISDCFKNSVTVSAEKGDGIDALKAAVEKLYGISGFSADIGILANERQRSCALKAKQCFTDALEALKAGATFDAVTVLIALSESSLSSSVIKLPTSKTASIRSAESSFFLALSTPILSPLSVMDIISADGGAGLKCAEALRDGALFRRIKTVSDGMLKLLGSLAAWVDIGFRRTENRQYPVVQNLIAVYDLSVSASVSLHFQGGR